MSEVLACPECGAQLPTGASEAPCAACLMKLGMQSWAARRDSPGVDAPTATMTRGFSAPSPAELNGRFPNLDVQELRGQGGMGAVYKARQISLDRLVALKIINPETAGDPGFASRFAREAKALARLNHPNIVGVHDFGEADGLFYFVMEYVDGVDLRALIAEGNLQPAEALALVPQLCDALQYAHEEGVVHRDIKPENILVDKRGRAKIADFGLAKLLRLSAVDLTLTHTRHVVGTFHYMAPEQFERPGEVDHRADIYALGVVIYEMLTGVLPVGRFDLPSQRCAMDARLDEVVLKALEREPDRRYQHASDVKTDVESLDLAPRNSAKAVPTAPTPQEVAVADFEEVRDELAVLAIGMIVYGTLALLAAVISFGSICYAEFVDDSFRGSDEIALLVALCAGVGLLASLIIATGVKMRNLENYDFVLAGSIITLTTFPTPITAIFALPLACWSLSILRRPGTRRAFTLYRQHCRNDPALTEQMAAKRRVGPLAIALVVVGVLNIVFPLLVLLFCSEGDRFNLAWMLISIAPGAVMLTGGLAMSRLGPYEVVLAGAAAALAPYGPGWFVSFPLGLATLSVLRKPRVKQAFSRWIEPEPLTEEGAPASPVKSDDAQSMSDLAPLTWDELEPRLRWLSTLLIVTGGLHAASLTPFVVMFWMFYIAVPGPKSVPVIVAAMGGVPAIVLATASVIIAGAVHLRRQQSYSWSRAAALAALFPISPAVLLGLPIGLLTLMTLHNVQVLPWFETPLEKPRDSTNTSGNPTH